jgi:RNA-binding protein YhbY
MPKHNITVSLIGKDGNAFGILGSVQKALKNNGVEKVEIDAYLKEAMSGDYDHLLRTTMEWVEVA